MGDNAGVMTDALTWAGTYHGIGARLLREYAEQIGRMEHISGRIVSRVRSKICSIYRTM